jgi:CHAT domain-containing protein/tetratricopeptide (TPR) repeat protein
MKSVVFGVFSLAILQFAAFGKSDLALEIKALRDREKWSKATELAEENLQLAKNDKSPGGEARLLEALEISSYHLLEVWQYETAMPLLQERLLLAEKLSTRVTASQIDLAEGLRATGQLQAARELATKALNSCSENDHVHRASALMILTHLEYLDSDFKKTEERMEQLSFRNPHLPVRICYKVALKKAEALAFFSKHSEAAALLANALDYFSKEKSLSILKFTEMESEMAGHVLSAGGYAETKEILDRVIPVIEKEAGNETEAYARALFNRGVLKKGINDFTAAEKDICEAYEIRRLVFGDENPVTLTYRERWCGTLAAVDGPQALKEYEQLLPDLLKHYGQAGEYLLGMANLANSYSDQGYHEKAVSLLQDLIKIRKDDPTTQPWQLIYPLGSMVSNLHILNRFKEASKYVTQLAAFEGDFDSLRPTHKRRMLGLLCMNALYLNNKPLARIYSKKFCEIDQKHTRDILSFACIADRMNYSIGSYPFHFLASAGEFSVLADSIIQHKSIVLDAIVREKRLADVSTDEQIPVLLKTLDHLQTDYRNAEFLEKGKRELKSIAEQVATTQEALSHAVGVGDFLGGMDITASQVCGALAPDAALVEYIKYYHRDADTKGEWRYATVIYQPEMKPQWETQGESKNTDNWLWTYEMRMRKGSPGEVEDRCRKIHDIYWRKIEGHFSPRVKKVYISGAGLMSHVSFATLVQPNGRFLGEKFDFYYLTSGRNLLRAPSKETAEGQCVIIGNPDFSGLNKDIDPDEDENREATELVKVVSRDPGIDASLRPLPGAELEARGIDAMLKEWGWKSRLMLGGDATEAAVRRLKRPKILHIATHGFSLFYDRKITPELGLFYNPMYRAGLTLSYADGAFQSWRNGRMQPPEKDGILLADEVTQLDLMGTWLVVLSACDSGLGHVFANEGKLGFERAFLQAGAENVLSAMWPIPDKESAEFMRMFYDELKNTGDPCSALAVSQRKKLIELRKSHGIAHAARSVGGFVMNTAVGNPGRIVSLKSGETIQATFESVPTKETLGWRIYGRGVVMDEATTPDVPATPGRALFVNDGHLNLVTDTIDIREASKTTIAVSIDVRTFEDSDGSDWEDSDYIEAWIEGSVDGLSFSRFDGSTVIRQIKGNSAKVTHTPSNSESDDLERLQQPGGYTNFSNENSLVIPTGIHYLRLRIAAQNDSKSERFFFDNLTIRSGL